MFSGIRVNEFADNGNPNFVCSKFATFFLVPGIYIYKKYQHIKYTHCKRQKWMKIDDHQMDDDDDDDHRKKKEKIIQVSLQNV